jgi:hypothetical protein
VENLATNSKEAQDRAEASFKKKELQARDASKAMAEYEAGLRSEREKTVRLRLLREAKEAAEAAAKPAGKPAPAAKPAAKAAVTPAAEAKAPTAPKAKAPAKKATDSAKKPAKKRALAAARAE